AFLVVLHDGSRFEVHEIERDLDAVDALSEIEDDFWTLVQADTPPPVDLLPSTERSLKAAYAYVLPQATVELDVRACARAREYTRLHASRERADREMAQIRSELMLALGAFEVGEGPGVLVTWKGYQAGGIDVDGLRKAHPDIAREFTRQTPARRFAVKAQQEEADG
ncbi:MAG TPA: hypothetical protein VG476_04495, partial [Acidimicrobiales bacterium]|nr:hypothetical protein [Acidimicrobiales bacterium]